MISTLVRTGHKHHSTGHLRHGSLRLGLPGGSRGGELEPCFEEFAFPVLLSMYRKVGCPDEMHPK
jgi:hypothetical protein